MGFENRNVKVAFLWTVFSGLSGGIWGFTVLSAYLQKLQDSNEKVGLAEGLQGAALALVAVPAGVLADRLGRDPMCRMSAFVGLIAITLLNFAIRLDSDADTEYWCFTGGLIAFGMYTGVAYAPFEAIFADSLSNAERPKYLTYKYGLRVVSAGAGPLTGMLLFHAIGNTWTLPELRTVLSVGTLMGLIPAMCVGMMSDKHSLGHESEAAHAAGDETAGENYEDGEIVDTGAEYATTRSPTMEQGSPLIARRVTREVANQNTRRTFGCLDASWVPYICASTDLIFGLASGMTIKFFPLFFKNEVGMDPIGVNAIFSATPFLLAVVALCLQRLSTAYGRVQVVVASKVIGITLLYSMWWMGVGYAKDGDEKPPLWLNKSIIIPVFICRTVLMNATSPLQKSILMDFVKKSSRGSWNAFDAITGFGWSGSAFLGGIVADRHGYGTTFLVTAIMQTVGLLVICLLFPLVPAHAGNKDGIIIESTVKHSTVTTSSSTDTTTSGNLEEPLLSNTSSNDDIVEA